MAVTAQPAVTRSEIATAIEAIVPDYRYRVDGAGISDSWTVSDDIGEITEADLLAVVILGGVSFRVREIVLDCSVAIYCTSYAGTRTAVGGTVDITAEDRALGAALHLSDVLLGTPIADGMIAPVSIDPLQPDAPQPDWYRATVRLSIILQR